MPWWTKLIDVVFRGVTFACAEYDALRPKARLPSCRAEPSQGTPVSRPRMFLSTLCASHSTGSWRDVMRSFDNSV